MATASRTDERAMPRRFMGPPEPFRTSHEECPFCPGVKHSSVDFSLLRRYQRHTLRAVRGPSKVVSRVSAVLLFLLLLAALSMQTAGAGTKGSLHWAERRLRELEHDIDGTQSQLASVKRQIDAAQAKVH